jgi:hypothetical protein
MAAHLVHVATAFSVSEAIVVQSMLRGYGIEAHTFDLGVVNVDPGLMLALGGIRIFEHADDEVAATDLIWTGQQQSIPPRSYDANPAKNGFWAIILALFGAPPPARIPLQKPD